MKKLNQLLILGTTLLLSAAALTGCSGSSALGATTAQTTSGETTTPQTDAGISCNLRKRDRAALLNYKCCVVYQKNYYKTSDFSKISSFYNTLCNALNVIVSITKRINMFFCSLGKSAAR